MMKNQLIIQLKENNSYSISGTLDFENVVTAYEKAKSIIDLSSSTISFDLSETHYQSSAGLALLLSLLRYAKEKNIKIQYLNLPSKLLSVAKISDVEHLISA